MRVAHPRENDNLANALDRLENWWLSSATNSPRSTADDDEPDWLREATNVQRQSSSGQPVASPMPRPVAHPAVLDAERAAGRLLPGTVGKSQLEAENQALRASLKQAQERWSSRAGGGNGAMGRSDGVPLPPPRSLPSTAALRSSSTPSGHAGSAAAAAAAAAASGGGALLAAATAVRDRAAAAEELAEVSASAARKRAKELASAKSESQALLRRELHAARVQAAAELAAAVAEAREQGERALAEAVQAERDHAAAASVSMEVMQAEVEARVEARVRAEAASRAPQRIPNREHHTLARVAFALVVFFFSDGPGRPPPLTVAGCS